MTRRPGPPSTGTLINVRVPAEVLAVLNDHAGGNRAALIRDILAAWAKEVAADD